jgi:hypothetical protein
LQPIGINRDTALIRGALGGIRTPPSKSLAQAAERLHDVLQPLTRTMD